MHTEASEAATRLAWASRSSIEEERVISSERHASISPLGGLERRIASATVSRRTLGSKGLVRKLNTPRRVAITASGIVPCAVRITTGSDGESRGIGSKHANPPPPPPPPHPQARPPPRRPRHRQRRQRRLPGLHRRHCIPRRTQPHPHQL